MKEESNPSGEDGKSSRRGVQDEQIVAALALGRTYAEAGVLAGVSDRTVARRMSVPAFARRVGERRDELVVSAVGQLTSLLDDALGAIRSGLDDESARTRVATGKLILDMVLKFRQTFDLEIHVAEIRAHLGMEN